MLKYLFGVIISVIIIIIFYYCFDKFFNINKFNLDMFKNTNKESYINLDDATDELQKSILNTNYFIRRPRPFNPNSSYFSFLTKFDPCFKPPLYKEFPYKASLFEVKYNCRPTTTGMFTDCGPLAPNSCPK
jgi:hypothetical protein